MSSGQQVVHLIVSRTATGSSCRFVAAFTVAFLHLTQSSVRHRASGLLHDALYEGLSLGSNYGSRGSFPTTSLPSSPLGSPRRWGGLGSRRNVSSFGSIDSSAGQDDDGLVVERYSHPHKTHTKSQADVPQCHTHTYWLWHAWYERNLLVAADT